MELTNNLVAEQLRQLPTCPGVYLMKNAGGDIIYVGKASSLYHRVRQYFSDTPNISPKVNQMVARINDIEFFVTNSEQEALILESNLIKRYRPHYNVRLKDDKAFPYLKIDLKEDWPRIYVTRRLEENGARYFGPFASAKSVRQTLKVLKVIFPLRSCSRTITGNDPRPCLYYHIHQCLGPCIGAISKAEYASVIKQVIFFLEGKQTKVIHEIEREMRKAAVTLNFEKAVLLRDQIQAIEGVIEGQRIAATVHGEQDAIAFVTDRDQAYVQVFFVRGGKLIGRESFVLQGTSAEEPEQIMSSFLKQFYASAPHVPPLVLLQHPVTDKVTIEGWLENKRGARVHLQVPCRGHKKQLVNIVAANAEQGLQQLRMKQMAVPSALTEALDEVAKALHLPRLPERIECYDISDIQGKDAVGSMVVFEQGKPKPSHYRRFRIKAVPAADDYAMLQEVLRRRFKRANPKTDTTTTDTTWAILPDLVLIDGGKGQLSAAREIMQQAGAGEIPVASLAKEREEIFIPRQAEVIILPGSSPGLQLLQRLRDEAHRFALGYHQKLRKKETFTSALDTIPGIGPKRKRALLKKFGSVTLIRQASLEELAAAKGMSENLARKIKDYL